MDDFQRWMAIGEEYLRQGLSIIPIGLEKKPLVQWKQYQGRRPTTDEVKTWCQMPDFQGFGVVTGSISGLFVLDIDNGADIKGLILPLTPTAQTGSGGRHYYFQYPKDTIVKNHTNILPHIDIRGDGGFAVLPPAKHPSGINYSWITNLSTLMAEMPRWLRERLTKPITAPSFNPQLLQGVPEGQRNDSAARLIGKLLRHLPPHERETTAWPLIESWNQRNNPPLSQIEIRRTYDSIAGRESHRRLNNRADQYKENKERGENNGNVDVNGMINDGCKQKINFELTESKLQIIEKLKKCNHQTSPKEVANGLEEFFKEYESKSGHWLYVSQHWNPRAICRTFSTLIKLHESCLATIQNWAAYFVFLIRKRKQRRSL